MAEDIPLCRVARLFDRSPYQTRGGKPCFLGRRELAVTELCPFVSRQGHLSLRLHSLLARRPIPISVPRPAGPACSEAIGLARATTHPFGESSFSSIELFVAPQPA